MNQKLLTLTITIDMKKRIFLTLSLVVAAFVGHAQLVLLNSDTILVNGPATEFELVAYAQLQNSAENPVALRWVKMVKNLPTGWASSVCDVNLCYPDNVDSADFNLGARGIGNIDGHFYPGGVVGSGVLQVRIFEVGNPSNQVTLTFLASSNAASTAHLARPSLKLYPVPAEHFLYVETGQENASGQIEIYNVIGKQVASYRATNAKVKIQVGHLPKGQYILRYYNGREVITRNFTKL